MRRGIGIGAIEKNKLVQIPFAYTCGDCQFDFDYFNERRRRVIYISIICRSPTHTDKIDHVIQYFPFESKYKARGEEIASDQVKKLSVQLEDFRLRLENFATKHRNEIKKDPVFRKQFQDMCAAIGVDPLASSKGFWAEKLGFGDFYYELSVQIVEVCLASSNMNGGIMTLDELKSRLQRSRNRCQKEEINTDDILRAIGKIKVLGSGFQVVNVGPGKYLIQSVPSELNIDHTQALELAHETSYLTVAKLCSRLNWDSDRAERVLEHLQSEGLAWVDLQAEDGEAWFWFPGLFVNIP